MKRIPCKTSGRFSLRLVMRLQPLNLQSASGGAMPRDRREAVFDGVSFQFNRLAPGPSVATNARNHACEGGMRL